MSHWPCREVTGWTRRGVGWVQEHARPGRHTSVHGRFIQKRDRPTAPPGVAQFPGHLLPWPSGHTHRHPTSSGAAVLTFPSTRRHRPPRASSVLAVRTHLWVDGVDERRQTANTERKKRSGHFRHGWCHETTETAPGPRNPGRARWTSGQGWPLRGVKLEPRRSSPREITPRAERSGWRQDPPHHTWGPEQNDNVGPGSKLRRNFKTATAECYVKRGAPLSSGSVDYVVIRPRNGP